MHIPTKMLLLSAAAALTLSACGSSDDDSSSTASTAASTPATTASTPTTTPTVTAGTVELTLSDYKFAPDPLTVKAKNGKVTFVDKNVGKIPHEMVVIKTDKLAADLGSGARISEDGAVGEIGEFDGGTTETKTLKLAPGHYALVCNIIGHYAAGMYEDMTVE